MSDELGARARIAQLPPATAPPLAAAAMEGEDELNAGFDALDRMFIDSGDEGGEEAEYGSAKLEQLSENGGFGVAELELEAGAGKPQGDHEEKAPTSSLWVCGGLMSTPRQSCRQSACVCVCGGGLVGLVLQGRGRHAACQWQAQACHRCKAHRN